MKFWKNKRGTDNVRSPDVEYMGEEFDLGIKFIPPEKEEKKYYPNYIEAKLN